MLQTPPATAYNEPITGTNCMDLQRLGTLIRNRREEKQWTQEVLAERTGVAVSTICSIENGTHIPMASILNAILKELGDDLLNEL